MRSVRSRRPWSRGRGLGVTAAIGVLLLAVVAAGCDRGLDEPDHPSAEQPPDDGPDPTDPDRDNNADPPPDEPAPTDPEADTPGLQLGYLLPETGPLAFLGAPQIEAVRFAVEELDAAGGVLGHPVTLLTGDEAGDPGIALETAERLLEQGVHAIIGAASSRMSLAVADTVTSAGALQCSPANTVIAFTTMDLNGRYARTAPSDRLQGPVLAATILADGNRNPALLARNDDYGQDLLEATLRTLQAEGADVAIELVYDSDAVAFDVEVSQVMASDADSVAILGFEEGALILRELIEQGLGPRNFPVYGADGLRSNDLAGLVDPGDPSALTGMRGTAPGLGQDPTGFLAEFRAATGLEDTQFAAEAYDCTVLIALAATAAGSTDGGAMAAQLVDLTAGGTPCTGFAACRDALEAGDTIAYQGASGVVLTRTEAGNAEPATGRYEVWTIDDTGRVVVEQVVESAP